MTPDELKDHGQRLYGHRWQTKLAVALGINPRTVRRWVAGESAVGRFVAKEIKRLKPAKS